MGCGAKEVGTISGEDTAKPASPAEADAQKEPVDRAKYERDRAQATKLLEDGHVLPPRVVENFEVIRTNDRLSSEDGKRAFEFRKAAFKHCYRQALAYDLELKGYVHMTVKYSGSGTSTVEQFETTLKAEGKTVTAKRARSGCFRKARSLNLSWITRQRQRRRRMRFAR